MGRLFTVPYFSVRSSRSQEKQQIPIFGYFRVFKEYPQKSQFGRVRQVPIRELGWEFPRWDLSHFAKFGIFMGIL